MNSHAGEKIEDSGVTAIVDWNVNDMTFRSITAIRNWRHEQINADVDFVAADLLRIHEPAEIDSFSEEINLIVPLGSNGRSDLLLGVYLAEEDYDSLQSIITGTDADNYMNALTSSAQGALACLPPIIEVDCLFPSGIGALLPSGEYSRNRYIQDGDSVAVFAHANIGLTDRLDLTTGVRYSVEDKSGGADNQFWYDTAVVRSVLAAGGLPDDGTPRNGFDLVGTFFSPSFPASVRDRETTGLISLNFLFSSDLMIYAGYHRGFKAGGVNLFREGVVSNSTSYAPETADSIELGLKAQYWNGRAISNLAVFDTEFSDLQINFFTGLEFRTENTGKARTQGFEFENSFLLTDALRLDLAATVLDAKFVTLDNPFLAYLSGRDTPRAPGLSGVATITYNRPVFNRVQLFVRGLASYSGSHYVGADVPMEQKVGSYTIYDASVGLGRDDGRWEALLWCKNCADKDYRTIFFNSTFQPGSFSAYLNAPRQYGVTLRSRF
jgi:outer membrane receptor protein involved in Fe transport